MKEHARIVGWLLFVGCAFDARSDELSATADAAVDVGWLEDDDPGFDDEEPGFGGGAEPTSGARLPIEVLGPVGTVRSATVRLLRPPTNAVLGLRTYGLTYEGKGSVRVNGGPWVRLGNDTPGLRVVGSAAAYGGIGGPFHTFWVEMTGLPWVVGENRLEFRFDRVEDESIGYRVIGVRVSDASGSLLPSGSFYQDDPRSWQPPLPAASDVSAGAALWSGAALVDGSGVAIRARCSDCHATHGEDLAYFNFSNDSIVARSVFHGLTEREGRQIASYVRNSDVVRVPHARPWHPPYQPGPGLDARPAHAWAAGAGVGAVLPSDSAMLPSLFGGGSQAEIDRVVDPAGAINLRELPVAIQFPDWNRWLPRHHPVDIWGRTRFESGVAFRTLQEVTAELQEASDAELTSTFSAFPAAVIDFLVPGSGGNGARWTTKESSTIADRQSGISVERAKLSLAQWSLVKQWELVQTLGLSERDLGPGSEPRQWPTRKYASFHLAAHYIGDNRGTSRFSWETQVEGTYWSSAWYQLQLVLSLGMHRGNAVEPVDWAYNYQHVELLGERSGVQEPLRFFQNLVAGMQQRYRPDATGVPAVGPEGWVFRELHPWRIDGDYRGSRHLLEPLASYTTDGALERRIDRAYLRAFLDVAERVPTSRWPRLQTSQVGIDSFELWYSLEPASYVPALDPLRDKPNHAHLYARFGSFSAVQADAFARLIPRLRARGVHCGSVRRLGQWAATIWPEGSWSVGCE